MSVFCFIIWSVRRNTGKSLSRRMWTRNSKKYARKYRFGMKSSFWKSELTATMFTFWCSQFQLIVRQKSCERLKASPPKKSSVRCLRWKSNYGAASFGLTVITSARSARTVPKKRWNNTSEIKVIVTIQVSHRSFSNTSRLCRAEIYLR